MTATRKRFKPAGLIMTVIFTIVCAVYMYPIILVLFNSLKTETSITTGGIFNLPDADTFAGGANYVDAINSKGFLQSLSSTEIINQIFSVSENTRLSNLVFMGMGEPLDNLDNLLKSIEIIAAWGLAWSPTRVTVSTIGVLPALKRFLDENKCHLAVSLHSPFDAERRALMPMQKAYPIEETVELIRRYDWTGQRRVSFEYIMFAGVNDTPRHAAALAKMLGDFECRINLIRFHQIPDSTLRGSSMPTIERFKEMLLQKGVNTTIRASRGEDILAACGMLSTKKLAVNGGSRQ